MAPTMPYIRPTYTERGILIAYVDWPVAFSGNNISDVDRVKAEQKRRQENPVYRHKPLHKQGRE